MLKKITWPLFAAALLLVAAAPWAPARAIMLGFDPVAQSVDLGSSAIVDVTISGLGDFAPDSLGTFDLDIGFDPAILAPSVVVFGTELDLFGLGSLQDVISLGPGVLNLFELSFDSAAELDTLQAGAFTLATLTFDTIGVGTSALTLSNVLLGDALGDPLGALASGASVTVNAPAVAVPEPGTLALFGLGLAGLALLRRRRAGRHSTS